MKLLICALVLFSATAKAEVAQDDICGWLAEVKHAINVLAKQTAIKKSSGLFNKYQAYKANEYGIKASKNVERLTPAYKAEHNGQAPMLSQCDDSYLTGLDLDYD